MLYDVLDGYRKFLTGRYTPATVQTYANRLETLLVGQRILLTAENLDTSKILDNLAKIRHKNHFSQAKNAFLHFLEYQHLELSGAEKKRLEGMEQKTHKKYRRHREIDYRKISNTIKNMQHENLRRCYQTMLYTGLRVSELAQITKSDVLISGNAIFFYFVGKGGQQEYVTIYEEEKSFFQDMKRYVESLQENEKLFFSANYLQIQAKKYGFQCHDLRRIFAVSQYEKSHSKKDVQKKLRHSRAKTTNIYLKSNIVNKMP